MSVFREARIQMTIGSERRVWLTQFENHSRLGHAWNGGPLCPQRYLNQVTGSESEFKESVSHRHPIRMPRRNQLQDF